MSEEAPQQTRSPTDNVRTEEATSQAGRWRHPSPAPGQTTSPAPVPDQSRVGYTTEPPPQVSPQPILQTENEATLTSTEMRAPHHQQTQQAGQITTIHIPQHSHHPHHKYQLLHGVVSDSQQQQQIIQHSNTVIQQQQQPQQQQQQQQPEVTDRLSLKSNNPRGASQQINPNPLPRSIAHTPA